MRTRRIIWSVAAVMLLIGISSLAILQAERLLTEDQALKDMLPGVDKVEKVTKVLTDDEFGRITARIGGAMIIHQQGSKAGAMAENREYTFYFGIKDNKKAGVAIFDSQPGKWGPVDFVIALDVTTGKVTNMAVTAYVEKRGRPIALRSFLSQFFGKTSKDQIEINKDINSISGATISAKCAAFQVKKVVVMYEEVFLNKPLVERLKDSDLSTRTNALAELGKIDKAGQDKLLGQLVEELSKKEADKCREEMIIFTLDAYSHKEIVNKLLETKLPAGVELSGDMENALNKLAESAKVKMTWSNDALKESARQVKMITPIRTNAGDNFYAVLNSIISRYGCLKCRAQKDDKCPTYLHQLNGDSIEITDLETAQKRSLEWWNSYNNKNEEEKKGAAK